MVRSPTGTLVTACTLSAALLVAGCGADEGRHSESRGEPSGDLLLQPVAAPGPNPFTESTATSTAAPAPVTRTQQPAQPGETTTRSLSGGTPGLYGGIARVGSCDVERQIDRLTRDRDRARAFARVQGISQASVPDHLRGLAPVVLRADTRVTGHGYRAGRTSAHHAVLQAGTAVLVDHRGVPRVRCACGNPLTPAAPMRDGHGTSGRPWAGYRPAQVIVVAPTARAVTDITIIDSVDHNWIERRIGHDVRHDRMVPDPQPAGPTRTPTPTPSYDGDHRPTDTVPATPLTTDAPEPTEPPQPIEPAEPESPLPPPDVPAEPDTGTARPDEPAYEEPDTESPDSFEPDTSPDSFEADDIGPEAVPETPDPPDGGGLIPDAPADTDIALDS
ncbi:hypothetical protein SLCG_7356 [Streptomyces lincolnensis]|nr:hypothetical protein SLCG_7356 [Streptomyces lincolnensis]